jgi:hypothetical protein
MHLHLFGVALAAQFATGIFKVANKLLFFVSTEIAGWPSAIARCTVALMCPNCASRSG